MIRKYPTAEIFISKPHQMNNWKWVWEVYLPDVEGQSTLADGTGYDREDCWRKAVLAREYIYKYGID